MLKSMDTSYLEYEAINFESPTEKYRATIKNVPEKIQTPVQKDSKQNPQKELLSDGS